MISQEEQMNLFPHLYEGYVPTEWPPSPDDTIDLGDWADWETTGVDCGYPPNTLAGTTVGKIYSVKEVPTQPVELDDDLGLPIVARESTFDKYGIVLDTSTSFGLSLSEWYEDKGFLTPKQIAGWKRFKENQR